MATTRKVLGQSNPAATTDATLYTVPAATDAVVSSIVVCETNGVATTFKISARGAGGTTTTAATAIVWSMTIPANGTVTLPLGITLQAAATLVVQAGTANVTFTAFGQENT
jgi:hypothetical protein